MRSKTMPTPVPRRLVDILRALPEKELQSLITRLGIRLDAQKRLDAPTQVARSLASRPEVRDTTLLPPASAELLHRIAEARGSLLAPALPPAVEPLAARGIVFVRMLGGGAVELILPTAFLLQLRTWEGEDPRGVRALLAQGSFETCSAVAAHYLGRPATPPLAVALEAAWETLTDPAKLAEELERLSPVERRLIEGVEAVGGEVDTEELLDLEREPMRLRGATGATPSRRGAGFALERRGFLIPVHPNRHLVPTEVAAVVGATHKAERDERRMRVRAAVHDGDYLPRRARFAEDPAPLAIAMALAVREPQSEVRAGVGTPRSLTMRMGQRFGRDGERITLFAALSRAAGLWEASALSPVAPPGSLPLAEVGNLLFSVWRRGGAWDEARLEAETYRVAPDARDASPIGALREMLLDALHELGEGRWVPWAALARYVRDDDRTPGVARLLRRWADRAGLSAPEPVIVCRRIALESLPALGILDVGDVDEPEREDDDEAGPALRLTSRGRVLLGGRKATTDPTPSAFTGGDILRVGLQATVAQVLALAPFADIARASEHLELTITSQAVSRALAAGVDAEIVRTRLAALAPIPENLSALLQQASVVLGQASFVPTAGFLWVDDENVRELLRTRRGTQDLFVDPSPPSGLLLAPGVELDRVVRRCRTVGVEVLQDGHALRVGGTTPPPPPSSAERRTRSSSSMKKVDG